MKWNFEKEIINISNIHIMNLIKMKYKEKRGEYLRCAFNNILLHHQLSQTAAVIESVCVDMATKIKVVFTVLTLWCKSDFFLKSVLPILFRLLLHLVGRFIWLLCVGWQWIRVWWVACLTSLSASSKLKTPVTGEQRLICLSDGYKLYSKPRHSLEST